MHSNVAILTLMLSITLDRSSFNIQHTKAVLKQILDTHFSQCWQKAFDLEHMLVWLEMTVKYKKVFKKFTLQTRRNKQGQRDERKKNTDLYWQFIGLGYLWLVRLEASVFSSLSFSVFMSLWEGSILASLGRWFCCYCLAWSPLLSTHQSGPGMRNRVTS